MGDGVKDTVINKTGGEVRGIPIVDPNNPIDWLTLAQLLVGTLISFVYASVFGVLSAGVRFVTGLWDAAASFLVDVFVAIEAQGTQAIGTAADATADGLTALPLGLAWVGGVAVVLIGAYIVAKAIEVVRDG